MCIALPGRIRSVRDVDGTPVAMTDFDGVMRETNLLFVPEAKPGDLVIAHSGFAVRLVPAHREELRPTGDGSAR
ncbi:MAG: HypC/HybG/HupF family hydrogenase formation chaperone [Actinobacteria bacterium]|nr:MAG: HypC/HybG/HupF family hydrogenase formation chaperone [Actinomycetota bacterium]